jgi:hypothetical protein
MTNTTFIPLNFRRCGGRKVATDPRPVHDATLLDALGRAHYWQYLVDTGRMGSGSEIARAEGLDQSVVNLWLRLTLLAPDLVERMMAGTQPRGLYLKWLQRHRIPVDWAAQRDLIKQFEGAP